MEGVNRQDLRKEGSGGRTNVLHICGGKKKDGRRGEKEDKGKAK